MSDRVKVRSEDERIEVKIDDARAYISIEEAEELMEQLSIAWNEACRAREDRLANEAMDHGPIGRKKFQ